VHSHDEDALTEVDADAVVTRRVRLIVLAVLIPLVAAAAIAVVVMWPPHQDVKVAALQTSKARGLVTAIQPCPDRPDECDRATVTLYDGDGPDGTGSVVTARVVKHPLVPRVHVGDRILMNHVPEAEPADRYLYVDQDRDRPLLLLAGLFACAVIALSRWRGVAALVALGLTGVVLVVFVLPAILHGSDPMLVSVVGSTVIMLVTLYLTHGINARTSVAAVGTVGALALTAVLGIVFVRLCRISGLSPEGAAEVASYTPGLDLRGLLVAGLVIGALGVLDDVTVTQTAAVWELSAANPAAGRGELLAAGLRIGRAHVASVVNTLVLAYAGASLPLLMQFAIQGMSESYAVSLERVAIEVVRGLVGSLGIIAAVPLTTALAAGAVAKRSEARPVQPQPVSPSPS
jgi:uncharacterized membrane protein